MVAGERRWDEGGRPLGRDGREGGLEGGGMREGLEGRREGRWDEGRRERGLEGGREELLYSLLEKISYPGFPLVLGEVGEMLWLFQPWHILHCCRHHTQSSTMQAKLTCE